MFYFLFFFLFSNFSDNIFKTYLPALSFPAGWKQFGIAWAMRAYLAVEPSRVPLTTGKG